jgi:hypothetical protein
MSERPRAVEQLHQALWKLGHECESARLAVESGGLVSALYFALVGFGFVDSRPHRLVQGDLAVF